jgi:glycosyltransferase involved in cell wall biosynthesis
MSETRKGFNLIGYATSPMGLGEDLRSFAAMLDFLGIAFSVVDIPTDVSGKVDVLWQHMTTEDYATSVFFMSPMECKNLHRAHPSLFTQPKTKVGYFLWELPDFPDDQLDALKLVDHIWCPSKFVQQAFFSKSKKLTLALPLPVVQHIPAKRNFRKELGITKTAFVVLFMLDLHSTVARKNPEAVIRVFQAFAKDNKSARLILKISRWQNLSKKALSWIPEDPRIKVIKNTLKPAELTDLYLSANCYLSLHRSEGFGRTLVEALQNGLYVVSTDFSGPQDFLSKDNALLIPWTRVDIAADTYPHQSMPSWWAQPSELAAVSQVKLAKTLSESGRNIQGISDGKRFGYEALASRYQPILQTYLK